jgi:hypothetical protein
MGESDAELWRLRKFAPQNWQESVAGAREVVDAPEVRFEELLREAHSD